MLKKIGIRKITVTTCSLIIICLLYIFPNDINKLSVKEKIVYEKEANVKVFLQDKYEYISMVSVNVEEKNELDKLKKSIELLIENKKNKLPNNFKALIPNNVKVNNIQIINDMCEIDFSKEFLNIEKDKLEQVYESIVYTITEFKDIEKVKILVEGKEEKILDRNIGINKIYDINSLKNITNTTIYYLNDSEDEVYYTPVTKIHNDEREKIEIIIEELKSSLIYQSNLSSYLSNQTKLKEYKIKENVMHITFNDKIFDEFDTNKILEEVKYTINMSVKDNYNVDKVVFNVNDKEIATTVLKTLEN